MIGVKPTPVDVDGALERVHHHTNDYWPARKTGRPAVTLCGLTKTYNPAAWNLPCCPMCREVLAVLGDRCRAEVPA